nr:hypothetical protein Iba_chr09fCG0100 [Ipomoea batatas]
MQVYITDGSWVMLRGVNVPDLLERGLILSSELHGHILEDNLFSHQISQLGKLHQMECNNLVMKVKILSSLLEPNLCLIKKFKI